MRKYLPDDLASIERGERHLGDEDFMELSSLYRLEAKQFCARSPLDLRLDGSTSWDIAGGTEDGAPTLQSAIRSLALIAEAMGGSLPLDSIKIEALAKGFGISSDGLSKSLMDESELISTSIGLASSLETSVVVPQAGILVANVPNGALVLARARCKSTDQTVMAPAACTLGQLGSYLTL